MPGQFQGEEMMPRVKQTNFDSAVKDHTMSALKTGVAAGILWLWSNPQHDMLSGPQVTALSNQIALLLWSNMDMAGQPSLVKALQKISDIPLPSLLEHLTDEDPGDQDS